MPKSLTSYRLLGRSGLRISPLALGAMTFGQDWGFGSDEDEGRRIFDAYVDRGGNFIDTAVNYTNGASERLLGAYAKGKRDRLVISTKFTMATDPSDPNSGGNHRSNLVRSVEKSLKQLDTDRLDLLYVHCWDFTTSPEEVMRSLDDLVRGGKILYAGISNTPAWRIAQMQTMADLRGWTPFAALQIEYNLIERSVEQELVAMAARLGLGVVPWSPLAGGVLTGKYNQKSAAPPSGEARESSRADVVEAMGGFNPRALDIAKGVAEIAAELEVKPSQIALAWLLNNPAVAAPLIGARTLGQLEENLGALEISFSADIQERLDQLSAPTRTFPHTVFDRAMSRALIFGNCSVEQRSPFR